MSKSGGFKIDVTDELEAELVKDAAARGVPLSQAIIEFRAENGVTDPIDLEKDVTPATLAALELEAKGKGVSVDALFQQ